MRAVTGVSVAPVMGSKTAENRNDAVLRLGYCASLIGARRLHARRATERSAHLMLHAALERAVKEQLIPRNPTEDCIAPKPRKIEMRILPSDDMHAYLGAAKARDLLSMCYLELVSGLRKGELVALRWEDLDIWNKTISVSKQYVRNPDGSLELTRPKTENSVRLVSIPQAAVELLIQEHNKHPDSPYLFPSPLTGDMYHPDSVVNLHKKILKDAGLLASASMICATPSLPRPCKTAWM